MYGRRITEVHLRQSRAGIWSETFQSGDVDYERLVAALVALDVHPHWVLEQAVSADSPNTRGVIDAHAESLGYAQALLASIPHHSSH
jgi:inosose dehydratase